VEKLFLQKKSRRSVNTASTYSLGLKHFASYMNVRTADEAVDRIKSEKLDVYEVLDGFVDYMMGRKLAPMSINLYLTAVREFLIHEDIAFDKSKLRERLVTPQNYAVSMDRAPTKSELKKLFMHASLKAKVILAMLVSSGMRIGELANLRVGDVDFNSRPTKITVRASETKQKRSHTTFISSEATSLLKEFLGTRIEQKEQYIFEHGKGGPGDTLYTILWRLFKKVNMKEKLSPESRRYAVHPHSFRKYFFSQCLAAGVERGLAEAWMGHKYGLDESYLRVPEEEQAKLYLKAEPRLTIMSEGEVSREEVEKIAELYRWLGNYDAGSWLTPKSGEEIIKEAEERMGRKLTIEEKIEVLKRVWNELIEERRKWASQYHKTNQPNSIQTDCEPAGEQKSNCKRYEHKIIGEGELLQHLDSGWEIVKELNGGRIVVRRLEVGQND
jgi:integrase